LVISFIFAFHACLVILVGDGLPLSLKYPILHSLRMPCIQSLYYYISVLFMVTH
jgi:hypothetical protein